MVTNYQFSRSFSTVWSWGFVIDRKRARGSRTAGPLGSEFFCWRYVANGSMQDFRCHLIGCLCWIWSRCTSSELEGAVAQALALSLQWDLVGKRSLGYPFRHLLNLSLSFFKLNFPFLVFKGFKNPFAAKNYFLWERCYGVALMRFDPSKYLC